MHHTLQQNILVHLLVMSILLNLTTHSYDQKFVYHVTTSNINTLTHIETKPPKTTPPVTGTILGELVHSLHTPRELKLKNLSSRDKRTMIFEQIDPEINNQETIIDQFFVDKMGLAHGYANPHDHLVHRLITDIGNNTVLKTEIGVKRFIEMLSQPTTHIPELIKRQTIIKELVYNDTLRTQCNTLLDTIKSVEHYFFELYTKQGLEKSEQNLLKFQPFFTKLGWNQPSSLTLSTRFLQLLQVFGSMSLILLAIGASIDLSKKIKNYTKTDDPIFEKLRNDIDEFAQQTFWERIAKTRRATAEMLFILTAPFQTLLGLSYLKEHIDEILNIQEILIGFATYVRELKKLFHLMNTEMPEIQTILQELRYNSQASQAFNQLNAILKKDTFARENPSIFSSPGNILTAYQYLAQPSIRKEYSRIFNMLGEIDVYVALANKIKSHQEYPTTCAQFCFVQFKEHAAQPMISAIHFWNPFIDYKNVVCNDLNINSGNERNIVLTGTNTGGKSTLIKAIMIAILLAQTFGIAPAQSLTITPFTTCLIYMNIADDVGAGISLFQAEVKRAHEIMSIIHALPHHEFAFVIIDEMFTGTASEKAANLTYNFMLRLNKCKNCLFITSTHFTKLIELEKITNGEIKNYHTGVILDPLHPDRVIQYTYKLTPGPSPIINAEQIAEEILKDYVT